MEENTPSSSSTPPFQATPPPPPPPPLPPPPLIAPASASQPPRRGRGWMVFAIILLVLLGISMLFNLGSFMSAVFHGGRSNYASPRAVGPKLEEVVRQDNDAVNKIAVVEVAGIITSSPIEQGYSMVDVIRAQLKRAEEDTHVKAVILKVDSPGGEVLASDEINRAITDFQNKSSKPVVVSMGNLAASGGYYISAPCRWIVANELTLTGSIGVILSSWNYRGLMDKVGVVPQTFKSGKYKDMLSGSREPSTITQEERDMVQGLINDTYQKFRQVVQDGRERAHKLNKSEGMPLSENWTNFADGRVLSGKEAYQLGFVDQLGSFETAVGKAEALTGISSANLIEYQQRYDLSDFLRLFGKSEGKTAVKIDLGIEAPKLKAGQPYFLSSTLMP
jgi:protease IV